ncbi:MAG: hypothetical protein R2727_08020 [Bacteroidales bacterium]
MGIAKIKGIIGWTNKFPERVFCNESPATYGSFMVTHHIENLAVHIIHSMNQRKSGSMKLFAYQ